MSNPNAAAVEKFRADFAFVRDLSIQQARRMARHANPAMERAGAFAVEMAERHYHDECNAVKDARSINAILELVGVEDIRAALVTR